MSRIQQTSFSSQGPTYSAVTIAAVGTLPTTNFSKLFFIYSGITAETFKVEGSINGVDFATTAGMRPLNLSTGVITTSSDLAAATVLEVMVLDVSGLQAVRFVKSAATEPLTIRTALVG